MRSNLFVTGLAIVLGIVSPIALTISTPEISVAGLIPDRKTPAPDRKTSIPDRKTLEVKLQVLQNSLNEYEQKGICKNKKGIDLIGEIADIHFKLERPKDSEILVQKIIDKFKGYQDKDCEDNYKSVLKSLLEEAWIFSAAYGRVVDQDISERYKYGKLSWEKVLEFSRFNLLVSRYVNDRNQERNSLHGIGWVYRNTGKFSEAINYYNQASKIAKLEGELWQISFINTELAIIDYDLGLYQDSLEKLKFSLLLLTPKSSENQLIRAFTLTRVGMNYLKLGNYSFALKYFNDAGFDNFEPHNNLLGLGFIYSNQGKYNSALNAYNQALNSITIGDASARGEILNRIGQVYIEQLNYEKASESFQNALISLREIESLPGEAVTLSNIGLLLEKQNQPQLSIAVYKQSVNIYESIRKDNEKLPKELRESYSKSIASTYQALANLLIKQGRIPEAQAVLELLKLKEINTYTRNTQPSSKGISFTPAEQKALDEFLNTYSTAATFARELSDCAQIKCAKLTQLEDQRDRNNTVIREMLDRLRITLKDQAIDLSKLNTTEFNNAAKAIVNAQPGTLLIYPIITENKIQFLIALKAGTGKDAPVIFRAIDGDTLKSEDLFTTTNQFRDQLSTPNSKLESLQANGQKLYNWLIKPLEPEINHPDIQHLVFVLDRATRHIPIAALHDGKQYLIARRHTLAAVTSATGTNPTAPPPSVPSILALGASQFQNQPPLKHVETELNAIVKTTQTPTAAFSGDRYLNTQFTFNTLKTNLKNHNILHIATHGLLDSGNIDNSHLLTSQGEKIDKTKIQLLNDYGLTNIHLVILSACNTGTGGKNSDNLEIAGISHYFMTNGAKSVIASLWQVNDLSTALFMQQFYGHLAQGESKVQAMQQVQQDSINGKLTATTATTQIKRNGELTAELPDDLRSLSTTPKNYSHPFYWAPFILIGNSL
jgi:CHAT domain-containing protein/Tfp pilus assembly protein PilF